MLSAQQTPAVGAAGQLLRLNGIDPESYLRYVFTRYVLTIRIFRL
jgi:hypothetical protein